LTHAVICIKQGKFIQLIPQLLITIITTPSKMRIVFTGGSGKAGRHCIPHLIEKGHQVLNLDLVPHPDPRVYTLKTDLTQSGQVFNALSTHFSMDEYSLPSLPGVDAVIHFAAYARDLIVPDNETFTANVTSTYNVIEAACKLGIKKVIIASSETVYGVCFTQGESDYNSWPLDEGESSSYYQCVTDK
jgi:nucleoside-diphosphate-sugar epimerase